MIKSLLILGITINSKLTLETHLRKVESKAARSLGVVRRAGNLFDCPRKLKSCFIAYILSRLSYWAYVWMSFAESHLGLLNSIVRSAESELCCLENRRKVNALCLIYKIDYRV